eukprot:1459232-Prymnesium_polylepis.1
MVVSCSVRSIAAVLVLQRVENHQASASAMWHRQLGRVVARSSRRGAWRSNRPPGTTFLHAASAPEAGKAAAKRPKSKGGGMAGGRTIGDVHSPDARCTPQPARRQCPRPPRGLPSPCVLSPDPVTTP